jgi:hypothetical protein
MTMKAAYPLLVGITITASAFAQNPVIPMEKPVLSDAVQKAIEEFNRRKKEADTKDNEVLVVLDPPAPPSEQDELEEIPAEPEEGSEPVLVTGKPPLETDTNLLPEDNNEPSPSEEASEELSLEPSEEPEIPTEAEMNPPSEPSLEARVESIRKGTGRIDPDQVKLKAGFPAKPLSSAPEGWAIGISEQAPVFRKDVELQPGTTISLSIRPHVLSPDSDGFNTFSVGEPGFESARGYIQEKTVSAILGTSVAQLDRDSLQLGNAISELHRLLGSLPKPENLEAPEQPESP